MELQAENLRKMFLAMAKDIRVIIIKLADRTAQHANPSVYEAGEAEERSRERHSRSTRLWQASLGISKLKIELDDLALSYLEPEAY